MKELRDIKKVGSRPRGGKRVLKNFDWLRIEAHFITR
jgi:hypothetical protein